jgi:nucleoid-associated protein YgaU
MFTAMIRRPIVWLLATMALLGAGWAAYGPLRQVWQPATETAGRGSEPGPAPVVPPAAPASEPAKGPGPVVAKPETAAAPPASERQPTETPASRLAAAAPETPAAPPAPERQLAQTPAGPPPAPPVAAPPEPASTPSAPVATAAGPEPSAVPEAGPAPSVGPPPGELAPAAGPPTPPAAPVRPVEPTVKAPTVTAAPPATALAAPAPAAPPVVARSGEPPATAPAAPGTPPPAPRLPAESVEHPSAAPEVAEAAPLPSTEPAVPATSPNVAPPASERSLSLDSIRRALAALLGGAPEPTDAAAGKVEKPAASSQAIQSRDSAEAAAAPEVVRPSFDIVRVEPGGRAVIAGRAAPGAEVELLAGDRVLDRVRADRRGEWVAVPSEPLPPGGVELTLRATSGGRPASEAQQVVVVVVPEPPPPQPAPVAIAEGPPPQPPEVRQASSGPLAVLLADDGRGTGRLLQAPGRISSDGRLALLMLDYDDSGHTRLAGEAPPGAPLRIYVDNRPAAEATSGPDGKWTAILEHDLAPGEYTLRLDQLGSGGRPVARLETPFSRVSQPPIKGTTQVDYVIVQPGNSLWRIARRLFGSGMEYVQIYDANKAQIRDPDLIYPGQVFEVPPGVESSG